MTISEESQQLYQKKIQKQLKENQSHLESLTHPGCQLKLTYPLNSNAPPLNDDELVFFFDIDNCLYKRSSGIHDLMQISINDYVRTTLNLSKDDAQQLQSKYYHQYGLAIQGLVKFHKINAIEYNEKVDDSLPLQDILYPDPELRQLLINLRLTGKVSRLWLFTNAYKNHALRVIRLLGIADLFDGLTYCDYEQPDEILCKPNPEFFQTALKQAGCSNFENCLFVDDSSANVLTAKNLKFKNIVHFIERDQDLGTTPHGVELIRNILDLPKILPEIFEP
ncbi:hypothetical protein WICMUC_004471 [Wickerhamomyces mucosus]|uniref:Pyrimidine 5'-nucleotidase n=1 Tax=Wickerhamomyces mucosus TaxID=1378264 RepID=A0A9P8PID2_9ASCO|nr:hypothetical protein WICMUC_004471 [Wickerhamomyces mucosus]